MNNELAHFAIYVEDIQRARSFYKDLFGWSFNDYGPGDFLQIKYSPDDVSPIGALQSRNYSPVEAKVIGFECSIAVDDIDTVIEKVKANKGRIVMPKTEIPHVGMLVKFLDSEGNLVCAIQYF